MTSLRPTSVQRARHGAGAISGPDVEFVCIPARGSRRRRLVCFPYAGGGASAFRRWAVHAADDVELLALQLPGRENRVMAPLLHRLDEAAELATGKLSMLGPVPTVLFGHSMGALLAYEVALRASWMELDCLAVSGRVAPHLGHPQRPASQMSDAEFLAHLRAIGGTPSEILEQPELMELLLPMLRADFEMVDQYRPAWLTRRLGCRVVALYGDRDAATPRLSVGEWSSVSSGSFTLVECDGGHFFLDAARERIVDVLGLGRTGPGPVA